MSRLVLVRHGRPEVLLDRPPSMWQLAEQAYEDVCLLSARLGALSQPVVLASAERKGIQTAEALALGPVVSTAAFNEVGKPWYEGVADQRAATSAYLAGEPESGWEPLEEAVRRFGEELASATDGRDVVVVSHGIVMTAWLNSRCLTADPFDFWVRLKMPDAREVDVEAKAVWHLSAASNET